MADDLNTPDSGGEYQNADQRQYGDVSESYASATPLEDSDASDSMQSAWQVMFQDRKKLIFISGGVLLFIFLMMSIFGGSDDKHQEAALKVSPEMAIIKDQEGKMAKIEQNIEKMATFEKKFAALEAADQNRLTKLVSQVNILKDQLVNTQKQLADVRKIAYDQQAAVRMLTEKTSTESVKPSAEKPMVVPAMRTRVTYSIKAIVPGRVWLDSSKGNSMTVTVGDHLIGYGVVKKVDARLGQVFTSSGKVITYGENDH